jgi:hypothetical protein
MTAPLFSFFLGLVTASRVASLVGELIEPLIVGRADERLEIVPEVQRVLSAYVGVECPVVAKTSMELKLEFSF